MADYTSIHAGNTIDSRVTQVATNTADIASLKNRMAAMESASAAFVTTNTLRTTLGSYPTRSEVGSQINTALANYAPMDYVSSAIASRPTSTQMYDAISSALRQYPTNQQMSSAIESALTPYATQTQLSDAIADAVFLGEVIEEVTINGLE